MSETLSYSDFDFETGTLSDWENIELPEDSPIADLVNSQGRIYATLGNGSIYVSDDLGITWGKVESGIIGQP